MADCDEILSQDDRCSFSQECGWVFQLYFCWLQEHWLSWPVLALLFILGIYLLSSTADLYFSSALSEMADKFRFSASLAGVTLLAFGNGAPDVFSSILAAHHLHIFLSLGSLVGAGLFVTAVVLARVILVSKHPRFPLSGTVRDIVLYTSVLCLLLVYGLIGEITWIQATAFPVIYVSYVIVVVRMSKSEEKEPLLSNVELPIMGQNYINLPEIIENYIPEDTSNKPEQLVQHPTPSSLQRRYFQLRHNLNRS